VARAVLVLVVDVANVMGSRPDGWWRDRAGAASRLMASLVPLVGATVTVPELAEPTAIGRIVAVIEGKARTAIRPAELEVVAAPADGDSTVVAVAQTLVAAADVPLVVTADQGLRARLPAPALAVGPRWLLNLV
jgi:hypothetical protein